MSYPLQARAQSLPLVVWNPPRESNEKFFPGESLEWGFEIKKHGDIALSLVDAHDMGLLAALDAELSGSNKIYFAGPLSDLFQRSVTLDPNPQTYRVVIKFNEISGNTYKGRSISFTPRIQIMLSGESGVIRSESGPSMVIGGSTKPPGAIRVVNMQLDGFMETVKGADIENSNSETHKTNTDTREENQNSSKNSDIGKVYDEIGDQLVATSIQEIIFVSTIVLWFVLRIWAV